MKKRPVEQEIGILQYLLSGMSLRVRTLKSWRKQLNSMILKAEREVADLEAALNPLLLKLSHRTGKRR